MKTLLRVFLCALLFMPHFIRAEVPSPVAGFSADKTQGCVSLTVAFTDASIAVSGDPVVAWKWYFGDGFTSVQQHPIHQYTIEGAYDVKLEITTQSELTAHIEKTAYILAGVAVPLNIGIDTAICEGSILQLDAGNAGSDFLWSTGAISQTINVSTEDMYHVSVTRNGCTVKDTISINLRPAATPNFSYLIASACLPAEVAFTDNSMACPGYVITSWYWQFGDGATSNEQNPVHTYTSAGIFNVKLSITDNIGTTITKPKKITIVDNVPPVVDLGRDTIICVGASLTLDVTNPDAVYLWNTGETQAQIEAYFPGEYFVEVTLNGCVRKDTVVIDNSPILYADFEVEQTGGCLPVSAAFTANTQTCRGSVVEWLWDFGDGTTSAASNPTHLYTTSGTFDVSLTVKNSLDDTYTSNQSIEISGLETPVLELGNDTIVCEGVELVLNAAAAGATYAWSTGETSPSISIYDPGKYSVNVERDGCVATDSINVTIVTALGVDFSYERITGCLPVKMKFTDNSTSCTGTIVQWAWTFGDGTTSDLQHPEHAFPAAGLFNVRLKVTNSSGVTISRTKKINIVPLSASVNLGNDTTICFGSVLQIDAGNAGADYLWNTGETTQTIQAADSGPYYVKVSMAGCEASDTINVSLANSANVTWTYRINSGCLPVQVDFKDSSDLYCGQTISEWKWEFGDGALSSEQHPSHAYLTADSFLVRLSITTSGGLTITKSRKIFITNNIPLLALSKNMQVCQNMPIHMDAGLTGATYQWTPSAGLDAANIRNPLLRPGFSGWYKVVAVKCGVALTDSVFIKTDTAVLKPGIIQDDNTLTATNAYRYEWYRDGNIVAGAVDKSIRIGERGYYMVKTFNHTGCGYESDPVFVIPVSGKEKRIDGITIKCSPNPSRGLVHILLSEIPKRPGTATVVDTYGRRLLTTTILSNVNPLNLVKLSRGLYFVELKINNKKITLPITLL